TTIAQAATGSVSLHLLQDPSDGVSVNFTRPITTQPRGVRLYMRAGQVGDTTAVVELHAGATTMTEVSFGPNGLGVLDRDAQRHEVPYQADQWYRVELRQIDWAERTFDLYFDGRLVESDIENIDN